MLTRLWWKIKYRRSPRWVHTRDSRFWAFQPGRRRRFMGWTDLAPRPDWSGWTDVGYTEDPPC